MQTLTMKCKLINKIRQRVNTKCICIKKEHVEIPIIKNPVFSKSKSKIFENFIFICLYDDGYKKMPNMDSCMLCQTYMKKGEIVRKFILKSGQIQLKVPDPSLPYDLRRRLKQQKQCGDLDLSIRSKKELNDCYSYMGKRLSNLSTWKIQTISNNPFLVIN